MVRMRTALGALRATLTAALGVGTLACGGESDGADPDDEIPKALLCENPTAVPGITGEETGFIACDAGFTHREERRDCGSIVPRPDTIPLPDDASVACTTDADCADLPHGHCVRFTMYMFGPATGTVCKSGCVSDTDCGTGELCVCGDPVGTCVKATCTTDADCGDLLCTNSPIRRDACSGDIVPGPFDCQTRADKCVTHAECEFNYACKPSDSGRACTGAGACGRPFLVNGVGRVAALEPRGDWMKTLAPDVASLEPAIRSVLAERWAESGLLEHASVAAFARFVLELLALGAKAELVEASQRALGDEIAHAELCFGLASAYAGREIGPSPLDVAGAVRAVDLADVAHVAFVEACIGETIAAVEAAEAAEHAEDSVIRSVLSRIAADELRHAELGWRFVAWALEHAQLGVRGQIASSLANAVDDIEKTTKLELSPKRNIDDEVLLRHGVLPRALLGVARRRAVFDVIRPLARTLAARARRRIEETHEAFSS
jgi:hypothetical protein